MATLNPKLTVKLTSILNDGISSQRTAGRISISNLLIMALCACTKFHDHFRPRSGENVLLFIIIPIACNDFLQNMKSLKWLRDRTMVGDRVFLQFYRYILLIRE